MLDLWFLTTNQIKLSHLRHMARELGVSINSFHQRSYYSSYEEPRILDRDILLEKSYESALAQWRKAKYSEESFFFFEDTSVAIDAFSKNGSEFPGTNVKYWMLETNFFDLDKSIRLNGNNRSVTVRSDIVLHIPTRLRKARKFSKPYIQFTGISKGYLTSKEFEIPDNALRPWQDARSFNKWFVPSGQKKPFSLLSPEIADKYDFRRKAFTQLIDFLHREGVNFKNDELHHQQLPLPQIANSRPLFLISGHSGAGKTTIAEYLVKRFGYMHFEASDFMRLAYCERLGRDSNVSLPFFAASVLKQEPWTVPECMAEYVRRFSGQPLVITGFRSSKEIERFKEIFQETTTIKTVFVSAPRGIRFERVFRRDRDDAPTDMKQMSARDKEQENMGLLGVKLLPGVKLLTNKGLKKNYYEKFNEFFFPTRDLRKKNKKLASLKGFQPLEESIILALGDRDIRHEYTTTEIAKLLNESKRRTFRTEKDNVSRFFNQKFSPFFSVRIVRRRALYKLSQTGRSLYMRLSEADAVFTKKLPSRSGKDLQLELFDS